MAKVFQVDSGGTLTTNLLSYYPFNGDATDFYSTNNLTTHNSPTFVSGKVNQAIHLVKASLMWADLATPSGFPTGNSAYSMSLWIKIATTGNISQFGGYGDQNTGADADLGVNDTDNKPFIASFGSFQNSGTASALSAGTYAHLVLTYDGAGTCKLYVNNTLQATQSSTITFTNNNITIGRRGNNSSQYTDGDICEVGCWSKVLSTTEISDLYNSGNGQTMINQAAKTLAALGVG